MAKQILNVEVQAQAKITVDDDTAYTILGLLELYCRANYKTIAVSYTRPADSDEEFKVTLDFEEVKEHERGNETRNTGSAGIT